MRIVANYNGDYKDGYNTALELEKFDGADDGSVLFVGIQCGIDKTILSPYLKCQRKILLDLWSPCAFFTDPDHFRILDGFDEVYSICPYTCDWTNNKVNNKLMKYSFYSLNENTIRPGATRKIYDVYYAGTIISLEHAQMIDVISRYKYIFVTQSDAKKATHRFISNEDKINLGAKSRIGLVFNKLYLSEDHLASLHKYSDWQSNKAFQEVMGFKSPFTVPLNGIRDYMPRSMYSFLERNIARASRRSWHPMPIAPQFKTRAHELALCKTLILCHRDSWNIIEDYYEPGKEFVYFESIADLERLIPEILNNFDSYQQVIENAYLKAKAYCTRNLIDMIADGKEFRTRPRGNSTTKTLNG